MPISTIEFKCPKFYNLSMTCNSHGWKNLSPFEWVSSSSTLYFSCFAINQAVDVEVRQEENTITVKITSHFKLKKKQLKDLEVKLIRSIGISTDTEDLLKTAHRIGKQYSALVKKGAGRLLRSPTLWEDATKTLFTTNCSWALTKKMSNSICSEIFSNPSPSGRYPFPKPDSVATQTIASLKKFVPIGYRAEYLIRLSEVFKSDPFLKNIESDQSDASYAQEIARELKGFGPYAATHLMVLSGHYDEIPIDTVVISFIKDNYNTRNPQSFIERRYKKWDNFKWWGLKFDRMLNKQNYLGN